MADQPESVEMLARTVARRLAPACRSLNASEFRDVVARVVSLVVAFRDDRPATSPTAPLADAPPADAAPADAGGRRRPRGVSRAAAAPAPGSSGSR